MAVDLRGKFSISQEEIDDIVMKDMTHPFYQISVERAKVMNSWHESEMDDFTIIEGDLFKSKEYIIKRSNIESREDYQRKVERMRLFPLEGKFLASQKRIYDENNVNRQYPTETSDFWEWKWEHFDDCGSSITEFYRDKVLFVKEVLGFGAVVTDLMVDSDGNTIEDENGEVVPYPFVIRPHELYNFKIQQGVLTLLVTKQAFYETDKEIVFRYTAYTPDRIKVWQQTKGSGDKRVVRDIANPFGEVPATLIRGEVDASSSFNIGKPRRFSLKGLYLAASELFYDLQQGSELFGHPIPVMPVSIVKAQAGIEDDEKYDSKTVKEQVGSVIGIPDDMQLPNKLFYQADMQGLQHLRDVIFKDLMSLIFNLAQVRDKSVVKSNVSGNAKFLDNVEEQGLLAQTADDMESIENAVMRRMATVREEDPDEFKVTYSKHYDLSSANEIWSDITEGLQYHAINFSTLKHLTVEYLRKRSAPQEVIDEVLSEFEEFGMPTTPADLRDLSQAFPDGDFNDVAENRFGLRLGQPMQESPEEGMQEETE